MTPARPPGAPSTFTYRRGRITTGQAAALRTLAPRLGFEVDGVPLDPVTLFGRSAPLALEIGFGMGEATLAMAGADPATDVLAVDVHTPGAGALLRALDEGGVTNVRVGVGDALVVLERMLGPATLGEVRVFFPDPWPKRRHHARRLVTPGFVRLAADRLCAGGRLRLATDWAPYADEMLAAVAREVRLANPHSGFAPRPADRPVTRFELQGLACGRQIFDVVCVRLDR